jgi:type 1 glutamine amidotransferase
MRIWHFLLMLILAQCGLKQPVEDTSDKIKLLILSGRNNHEWQKTTPLLAKFYNESGRFETVITNRPDTLSYENFKLFSAVVSNWAAWPEHDYRWPKSTEEGLMKFIEEGGGFVLFHAASATFYDWPEYQQMVGTTWGDSTAHGKIVPHKIIIKDQDHPITEGMNDFWITDELWVNAGVNSELNVLAESHSDPSNKGRGIMEPVVHWNSKRKGRIFHNILGHNQRAMKNTGWKTLMLRGTEWAATGDVSIPVPMSLSNEKPKASGNYSWFETDTTFALLDAGNIVWQYNYNTIKGKPFFHPVNINKSTITWLSPEDHPWHLGIWHSWKFINGVNYWEYDRSEGVAPFNFLGVTEVRSIKIEKGADFSSKIMLDVFYHEKDGPDLINEERGVQISAPDEEGQFVIDYVFKLKALAETVELNRTPLPHEENGKDYGGYAGLSIRFSPDLFEPSFINSDGSTEMNHGKPASWKYYGLRSLVGQQVGVTIYTGIDNLNYPEFWFVTDSEDHPFYYISPAPIFNGPYIMQKDDELKLKYRMQFYAGKVHRERLKGDYEEYLKEKNQ